jgi:hypothetical protein
MSANLALAALTQRDRPSPHGCIQHTAHLGLSAYGTAMRGGAKCFVAEGRIWFRES